MWLHPGDEIFEHCIKCRFPLYIYRNAKLTPEICKKCDKSCQELRCTNSNCNYKTVACPKCLILKEPQSKVKQKPQKDDKKNICYSLGALVLLIGFIWISSLFNSQKHSSLTLMQRLREKFPSQKNETFYHILSVLEQEQPTVKSITLLHKNDMKTSNCLAKELVNIFSESGEVVMGEVSFDIDEVKHSDYGEVLEYYHDVVKRFRVLVTNLSEVPAGIAKVFHSLCDEVASDVKPSLFIFILRQEKETNSRPLEKATAILREAWSELPDSDLFPLLSRVIKNVVDVIPEKTPIC